VLVTQLISTLQKVLAQVAEPNAVLSTILQQAVDLTGATRGVFVEVLPEGTLEFRVLHRYRVDLLMDEGHYSRSVFSMCLETGKPALLSDASRDPRFQACASVQYLQLASVLCIPIHVSGRIAALVHLENRELGYFREEHLELLRPLTELAAPVLEACFAGSQVLQERDRLAATEAALRQEAEESRDVMGAFARYVGRSIAVRQLEERIRKAAGSGFPVLLLGETGTGKSILARVIHSLSARSKQPFVTVFCPSLEKSMVEAELFGHRRGSFTGAVSDRMGKVQAAEHGTLFLDEIGDLPLEIQPKLLRLLQEKTYERLGDHEERKADVRVIAATNRDLDEEILAKRFRRDLFERLNYVPVVVPPLRERKGDIPLLLRYCLDQTDAGRWIEITPEAERYLDELDFSWPGNVRHIEQLAARLSMEERGRPMTAADILRHLGPARTESTRSLESVSAEVGSDRSGAAPSSARAAGELDLEAGLPKLLEEAERSWLEEALRRYPRLTRAELAKKLRISESALYKKLHDHQLS